MKKTVILEPSYSSFHFFIYEVDESLNTVISEAKYHETLLSKRVYSRNNVIVIATKSEFSAVPITIQVMDSNTKEIQIDKADWDDIKEISEFEIKSGKLKLMDPPAGDFFNIDLPIGTYSLKICYGGQDSIEDDGSSRDYYLIAVYPK